MTVLVFFDVIELRIIFSEYLGFWSGWIDEKVNKGGIVEWRLLLFKNKLLDLSETGKSVTSD